MTTSPKPEVLTNRPGQRVADGLSAYWAHLLTTLREPPDLAIATAYFNPGGFTLLADSLERAGHVRLLLGAEPDVAADLRRRRALRRDALPEDEARLRLQEALRNHHRRMAEDRDLTPFEFNGDQEVERMISWLRSGRVEVRRLTQRFLHGKAFLVESGHDGVLAGSSNFTHAGLATNVELNLGQYQPGVVTEVADWFHEHWDAAEPFDLAALYDERFQVQQPFHVYLRMLWERYKSELDRDEPDPGLHLTAFQRDGLYRAIDYLSRHGGVLIADGVGLGKTYLAGELIRRAVIDRRQRVLLVAPAALRDGTWKSFLKRHDLQGRGVQTVSYQELAQDRRLGGKGGLVLEAEPDQYALIVIDEAHAYRNPDTERAGTLRRLLEGTPRKEVVLLTATPVNNGLSDLYHLLSYFIRNDAQFLPAGIPSLRQHFAEAEAEDPDDLSPDKLFDVLDAVAVRRTRRFVKKFYPNERVRINDVETVIAFPQPIVQRIDYDLGSGLPDWFNRFAHALGVDPEDDTNPLPHPQDFAYGEQLTLARYVPTAYRKSDGMLAYELQASGLLRSGLLKRFESSVFAFASTCRTMARSHDAFLGALDDGWVLTGDALAAWRKTDSDEFDPSEIARGRAELASDYDLDGLRTAVSADRDLLDAFADEAELVAPERDPKLDALLDTLADIAVEAEREGVGSDDVRDKRKVIVFSYYADTVEWIRRRLTVALDHDSRLTAFRHRVAYTTGSSDDTDTVLFGFAPRSTDAPAGSEDRFDLLITTDVLAEGVNLQQARHIINFDLPWNPMRLVQRHGRIDRIGSNHLRVYLRCFFPSRQLDQLLNLEATIQRKITQAAKSIGVEGEIIPGAKSGEQTFAHTRERIERLRAEDPWLFEEAADTGERSGEEFRLELADAFRDATLRDHVVNLPWASGSGRAANGPGGFVFCARIGDDPLPRYRWVPIAPTGALDPEGVTGDTLTCLAKASAGPSTRLDLPDAIRLMAYLAWEVARTHVFDEWIAGTDPSAYRPSVPKPMRDAADVLRAYPPPGMAATQVEHLLDTLEAPYDLRTQRVIRRALADHRDPADQVTQLIRVVDELGLQPPAPLEPLPEIELDDVHLVTWMALVPSMADLLRHQAEGFHRVFAEGGEA
jgi:hypothetical protein